jgi:aminobenzoyl-glutamate utilization protein B
MSIGHKSLLFAARTMAVSIIDLLVDPVLLENAQNEFRQRMKGREYLSALTPDIKPPHHQFRPEE